MRHELEQLVCEVDRAVDVLSLGVAAILAVLQWRLERAERPNSGLGRAPQVPRLAGFTEEDKDGEVARYDVVLDLDHDTPLPADRGFS